MYLQIVHLALISVRFYLTQVMNFKFFFNMHTRCQSLYHFQWHRAEFEVVMLQTIKENVYYNYKYFLIIHVVYKSIYK